jgi:hypothetical protein
MGMHSEDERRDTPTLRSRFLGQRAIEFESGAQQFAAKSFVLKHFWAGFDPAVHLPALHDHRRDAGRGQSPSVMAFTEADQHPVVAGAAKQIAVQEPSPTPEHGFLGYTAHGSEIVVQQLL